jgi:hypothetical protein
MPTSIAGKGQSQVYDRLQTMEIGARFAYIYSWEDTMIVKSGTARKVRKDSDPAAERQSYLMSDTFAAQVTDHFEAAATAAIARYHEAGLPVHGEQDGSIVEVTQRSDKGRADT